MANFQLKDKGFSIPTGATVTFGRVAKLVTTADWTATNVTATTDIPAGVFMESVDTSKVATGKVVANVRMDGIATCEAGATGIARGDRLTIDNVGRVVVANPAAGTNVRLVGIALTPSVAIGDWIEVDLRIGTTFQG